MTLVLCRVAPLSRGGSSILLSHSPPPTCPEHAFESGGKVLECLGFCVSFTVHCRDTQERDCLLRERSKGGWRCANPYLGGGGGEGADSKGVGKGQEAHLRKCEESLPRRQTWVSVSSALGLQGKCAPSHLAV